MISPFPGFSMAIHILVILVKKTSDGITSVCRSEFFKGRSVFNLVSIVIIMFVLTLTLVSSYFAITVGASDKTSNFNSIERFWQKRTQ